VIGNPPEFVEILVGMIPTKKEPGDNLPPGFEFRKNKDLNYELRLQTYYFRWGVGDVSEPFAQAVRNLREG